MDTAALHQLVLDNTIVGVAYMEGRRFLWANARMAQIFGYEPGELDGQSVRRLYVTQEDFEEVGRIFETCVDGEFYTHEHPQVCKDGRLVWCRVSGRRIYPGNISSPSVWVVQDLTERKHAEDQLRRTNEKLEQTIRRRTKNLQSTNEALRLEISRRHTTQLALVESRQKYRALFRSVPIGLLVIDDRGKVLEFNDALLACLAVPTRAQLEDLVHANDRMIASDGTTMSIADLVSWGAGSSRVRHRDVRWQGSDGGLREFAVIAAKMPRIGPGILLVFNDVTGERQARRREHAQQEALAHASRVSLMGQMASALAHELGQPLTACQSYLSGIRLRLARELEATPDIDEALKKATLHIEQAREIIGFVRGFVARSTKDAELVDLALLVDQTLRLVDPPIRSAGIRICTSFGGHKEASAQIAYCSPIAIQQVLVNLIMNAVDALQLRDRDRQIELNFTRGASDVTIVEVANNGPGIPAELEPQLFDAFVTTKAAGLGMGLMICRTIVESHGGKLELASARDGNVRFRFTIDNRRGLQ